MSEEKKTLQELLNEYKEMQNSPADAPMSMPSDTMATEPVPESSAPIQQVAAPETIPEDSEDDNDDSDEEEESPASENVAMSKIAAAPEEAEETPHAPMMSAMNSVPQSEQPTSIPSPQSQQNENSALMDKLLAAQQEQKKQQALAMIQRGGAQMLGGATHRAPDYTQAEALEKQAGQGVTDIQQQVAMQDVQNKLNDHNEMANPDSVTSKMLRDFARKIGVPVGDNVSGAHIEQAAPFLVKAFAAQEVADARKSQQENALQIAKLNIAGRSDIANTKADAAGDKAQDAAYQKAVAQLNTSRLPPDVKQAKIDSYLASKANTILDKYPDLNKISPQQAHLVLNELGKIATGGVPTTIEMKGIDPNTFQQAGANLMQKFTNAPQGANLGAFLQQQKDYLHDLDTNAKQKVNGYNENIIGQYEDVMGDAHTAKLRKQFNVGGSSGERTPQSTTPGMVKIQDSQGGMHMLPTANLDAAKKRDPGLKVVQ